MPATPKGITIQPEGIQSIQRSLPRISLPWHGLVELWSQATYSPTLSPAIRPTALPTQLISPRWTSLHSQSYDITNLGQENNLTVRYPPLQDNVMQCFGIKAAYRDNEDKQTLERHLRPFVIERHPEETQRAVQDLMDPNSTSSIQIFLSYWALLFSNDLITHDAIQAFLVKAKELDHLKYLKPVFSQRSPSARAIVTRLLHAAIDINAIDFLRKALNSGADKESPSTGEESETLLQKALRSHQTEVAQLLIDAGANVGVGVLAEETCGCPYPFHSKSATLCFCEMRGKSSPIALTAKSFDCVNLLPKLIGIGVIIPERCPVLLWAILHDASVETVSCLISAGADIDECASQFDCFRAETPLSAAAEKGNSQIVQLLLHAGANPNGPLRIKHKDVFKRLSPLIEEEVDTADELVKICRYPLLCAIESRFSKNKNSSYDIVRLLLNFGADPNISALDLIYNESGWLAKEMIDNSHNMSFEGRLFLLYPLQVALKLGDTEIAKLLLQHKACVKPLYGTPALTVAALQANIEMVDLLLNQNADPNGLGSHHYCKSALEAAVEIEDFDLIDLLLAAGADVNRCSVPHGGRTPLQRAAEIGEERVIEYLLKHGASMLSPPAPFEGVSVLQGFIRNRLHGYVSEALIAETDLNWEYSSSPLAAAVVIADTVSLRLLLAAGADVHKYASLERPSYLDEDDEDDELYEKTLSPIQWAAALNHLEVAKILCDAGANVNQAPYQTDGDIALHLAVCRDNLEVLTFLVAQEVDIDACHLGSTALNVAIKYNLARMIQWLLRYGADPNQPYYGYSAYYGWCSTLEQACFLLNDHAVRSLLRAGADISRGCALLSVCCATRYGWSTDSTHTRRKEILEVLLDYRADVNKRYHDTDTPLQKAIKEEDFDYAYRLIEVGAHINDAASKGDGGRTALQAAASVGNVNLVEQLLLRGADVNAPAVVVNGVTALQAAAIKGYLRIAQILLEYGADIDAEAGIENGRVAIEGAAEFGRIDMVKFLLDNYQGPKLVSEVCARAYKEAEKGNQWFVMELLENYNEQGEVLP